MFITASVVNSESTTTPTFADNSSSGASIYLGGNAGDQYGGNVALKAYGAAGTATCNLIIFENRSGTNTFAERARIDSSGNLMVGTTQTPATLLSDGQQGVGVGNDGFIVSSRFNDIAAYFKRENSNGNVVSFLRDAASVGTISVTTSATSYNTSSDYRLKENVDYTFNALDRVAQLKPARFNFIADADNTVDGFLAHEVQDIVPEAITGEKDAVDDEGNPEYQGIDQSKLVPLLTKAIQELSDKVDNQQTIIDDLKTRIETLESA
jgi:hypothetical protein